MLILLYNLIYNTINVQAKILEIILINLKFSSVAALPPLEAVDVGANHVGVLEWTLKHLEILNDRLIDMMNRGRQLAHQVPSFNYLPIFYHRVSQVYIELQWIYII